MSWSRSSVLLRELVIVEILPRYAKGIRDCSQFMGTHIRVLIDHAHEPCVGDPRLAVEVDEFPSTFNEFDS